jgi:methylenetetrahydrofolate dehydrogenase (NAD+)
LQDVLPMSDAVISGVPTPKYKVDTSLLKEGVIAVNFSSFNNFTEDIHQKASLVVKSVGKVTCVMLERNLLRLHEYQMNMSP